MHVITVLAQKGGAGKTTISVNLAVALALQHPHLKVAVADADPQESSFIWLKRGKGASGVSVTKVAVGDSEGKSLKTDLAALDADIVVIDLPPSLEAISLRGAIHGNLILVPTNPSIVDLSATRKAVAVAKEAIKEMPGKQFLLIPNRVQNNTSSGRQLRDVLKTLGPVSSVTLCQRIAYSEAAIYGIGVSQHAPESPAAQEIGLLAEEVTYLLSIT